jgi:hypothetical protein
MALTQCCGDFIQNLFAYNDHEYKKESKNFFIHNQEPIILTAVYLILTFAYVIIFLPKYRKFIDSLDEKYENILIYRNNKIEKSRYKQAYSCSCLMCKDDIGIAKRKRMYNSFRTIEDF